MSGFAAFFDKELLEIRRTWRLWVIPSMLLFFGSTSPILALVTPSLLSSIAGAQPGVVITVPTPTALDAGAQFLKSLSQLVIFALIIGGAGAVSGERSSGTAVLALTKPLSRGAFVLAKVIADTLLLIVSTIIGTLVCGALTRVLFESVDWRSLVAAVAVWLVFALLVTAAMHLFSVWCRSRGAAAGAGLAFLFLTLLAGIWPPMSRYTFVGLTGVASRALAGQPVEWGWPVATALALAIACVLAAVRLFERQEL